MKRKPFHNKDKLKESVTTEPALEKILRGILCTEEKDQHMNLITLRQ